MHFDEGFEKSIISNTKGKRDISFQNASEPGNPANLTQWRCKGREAVIESNRSKVPEGLPPTAREALFKSFFFSFASFLFFFQKRKEGAFAQQWF